MNETKFEIELQHIINKYSQENGSDTPDYILAKYLTECLVSFNSATIQREKWYGRKNNYPQHLADELEAMPDQGGEVKKTYADYCAELASKTTKGPWIIKHHQGSGNLFRLDNIMTANEFMQTLEANRELISQSRTLVPELARRLKRACDNYRKIAKALKQGIPISYEVMNDLADELEDLPEGEK